MAISTSNKAPALAVNLSAIIILACLQPTVFIKRINLFMALTLPVTVFMELLK